MKQKLVIFKTAICQTALNFCNASRWPFSHMEIQVSDGFLADMASPTALLT
jgi:pyruvate formate-lyase activating enzyme-like uncharacterized protein